MLSKIKSNAMAATEQARVSFDNDTGHSNVASEDEDAESTNQDNNNNSNTNNNNNNNKQPERKRSQEELLDIVEISRKRRLSKDSADSLGNFIRWSYGHRLDPNSIQRDSYEALKQQQQTTSDKAGDEEDMLAGDEDDDWSSAAAIAQRRHHHHHHHHSSSFSALNKQQFQSSQAEQILGLRQQTKFSSSGATNLTLVKNEKISSSALLAEVVSSRGIKRARTSYMLPDSPSPTISGSVQTGRKSSSYLGNVVERLHQQQQQQQQQEMGQDTSSNANLSYHLQRFLQQQTSLEDLCSQVGIDDSNQLVLAAAIHRALVDSVGPPSSVNNNNNNNDSNSNQVVNNSSSSIDNKSIASSTGSSSGGSSNKISSGGSPMSVNRINQAMNTSSANLNLVDSMNRQRRVYNTRAAMHGATGSSHHQQASSVVAANLTTTNQQTISSSSSSSLSSSQLQLQQQNSRQQHHSLAGLTSGSISSRVQQQRHAQAAAALSALASVGSASSGAAPHHQHQNQISQSNQAGVNSNNNNNQMVDFECDTCGSSFDDRHRLMQHQSIHLELKKDWFNETPVDEVMKIFNRRRGEFLCNTCNLRFEATFDYDKHNHSVHGQRPYCCQFCGNGTRTFRFWRQYLNHLYDHRYIFSCTIDDCDFTVNRRDSLRFHIFRFHLNCQLPQSQQHQLRSVANGMLGGGGANSRWPNMSDHQDGDDDDSDMNVG